MTLVTPAENCTLSRANVPRLTYAEQVQIVTRWQGAVSWVHRMQARVAAVEAMTRQASAVQNAVEREALAAVEGDRRAAA